MVLAGTLNLVEMLSSKVKTWFFLSYLVLLLNFGPSLHHAPIFGLHGLHNHSIADSASSACCSCNSHSHSSPTQSHSVDLLGSFSPEDGGCALCKFFDEYNVVGVAIEFAVAETPVSLMVAEICDVATADVVAVSARGPPSVWLRGHKS